MPGSDDVRPVMRSDTLVLPHVWAGACQGLVITLASSREGTQVKRPTIADIASRAGVTKAAVSFALNGQPGVSAATRERILAIASEIGFQPSSAARALSDGRAGAFGLVVDRPARTLGIESYFMQLISGIQAELSRDHIALLFTTAEDQAAEIELYRTWWAQRRVDGVFLVDLQLGDQRVTDAGGTPDAGDRVRHPEGRRARCRPSGRTTGPPPGPWWSTWPASATGGSPG